MNEKLKRILSGIFAFILCFIPVSNIFAASGTSSWISGYYYKSGYNWGQMPRLYIDGEDVFCLEQSVEFLNGEYSQGDVSSVLTTTNLEKIELIHHFGYVLNGKGDRNRAFTQVAIWETVGNYTKIGSYNGGNDRRGDYESWLADVNSKINTFKSVPSWNGTTVKSKVGETITLDGEGRIAGSYVEENGGSSVWAEDGKIKIKVTENSQNGTILLLKNPPNYDDIKGVTLVYQKAGSQKVGKIKYAVDPPPYRVNLEIQKNPTRARIFKKGEAGEVVPGAKFEMCYSKDFKSTTVYHFTTGSDGYTEWDTWRLFGQKVYVREVSVPAPYIKSDEIKEFTVEDGKELVITFINKKRKAKLKLAKVGEILEKYVDEKVTVKSKEYSVKKPTFKKSYVAGAVFDIKQNGKVIKTVTSKNNFTEVDLPLGKYQVVEKQAPDGYIKTNKVYDVDLTGTDEVVTKTLEIENEREKVKLNLTKSFEKGKFKHETFAVFGLFTKEEQNGLKKDTLIEVLAFDKENSTKEFKNTIKGKYYIKELDTSSGYKIDKSNHDVNLTNPSKIETKTILNKLKRGGIQILKLAKNNKEIKLEGVEFKLLTNNSKRTEIATKSTNKDGIATFENLEVGEYILKETKTKDGYILDTEEKIIKVKEDNKITMETVENSPTTVVIHKFGTDTKEEQLEDCEFEIIEVEEKGKVETEEKQVSVLEKFQTVLNIFKKEKIEENKEDIIL